MRTSGAVLSYWSWGPRAQRALRATLSIPTPPRVVRVLGDAEGAVHMDNRLPLGQFHLRLTQRADGLFRRVPLPILSSLRRP